MIFWIKSIVLWPRFGSFPPRILPFSESSINVITGKSRTGKSAIIPIIDYCLGAEKCTIPVTTIRDACEWFGIVVQTEQGEKLYARREPGANQSTNEMFVLEGVVVSIPEKIPEKNATSDVVRAQLDDLAGLSSLAFDPNSTSGFSGRPSFRDLMAFTFQPQNVIANPNVLFYKADTFHHREKLRTIFPYVIGAVTADILAKQHELNDLRKELRIRREEMENAKKVTETFLAGIQAYVDRARELGLIAQSDTVPSDREGLVRLLKNLITADRGTPRATTQTISSSADELTDLRQKEAQLSEHLAHLRQRFIEMTELKRSSGGYKAALNSQRDRLAIAGWLRERSEKHHCPVCGNSLNNETQKIDTLLTNLEQIENAATQFENIPASLDREDQRVRGELDRAVDSFQGVQLRLKALQDLSLDEQRKQYTQMNTSRFLGRLEANLRLFESVGLDSNLQQLVANLEKKIRDLEKEVSYAEIRERQVRLLAAISGYAARLIPKLDSERPHDPIELSVNDLSVKVKGIDREDYLWEIGSGSNWLSYHIAISVALQLLFATQIESPVPHFLIYDQPSQVYFPQKLVNKEKSVKEEKEPDFTDEDVEAVRKIFVALSFAIAESNRKLQVIVLDHAPESVWEGIANVNLVEDWHTGLKLVPVEWVKAVMPPPSKIE